MAGIHDTRTHEMLTREDVPIDDGSWPMPVGSRNPGTDSSEMTRTGIGQEMHIVQMRINSLGARLCDLYLQDPVDQEEVARVKDERSGLRAKNRKLERELRKRKIDETATTTMEWCPIGE